MLDVCHSSDYRSEIPWNMGGSFALCILVNCIFACITVYYNIVPWCMLHILGEFYTRATLALLSPPVSGAALQCYEQYWYIMHSCLCIPWCYRRVKRPFPLFGRVHFHIGFPTCSIYAIVWHSSFLLHRWISVGWKFLKISHFLKFGSASRMVPERPVRVIWTVEPRSKGKIQQAFLDESRQDYCA